MRNLVHICAEKSSRTMIPSFLSALFGILVHSLAIFFIYLCNFSLSLSLFLRFRLFSMFSIALLYSDSCLLFTLSLRRRLYSFWAKASHSSLVTFLPSITHNVSPLKWLQVNPSFLAISPCRVFPPESCPM